MAKRLRPLTANVRFKEPERCEPGVQTQASAKAEAEVKARFGKANIRFTRSW